MDNQRVLQRQGRLAAHRQIVLDAVPYWSCESRYASRFDRHVEALRTYVEREQHCNVPQHHLELVGDEPVALGSWVVKQRMLQRQGRLAAHRQIVLDAVPCWSWGLRPKSQASKAVKTVQP